jgi:sec-independent protein translocase protein TatC
VTKDIEYSFWDHLNEARNGILRSLLYVVAGSTLAWFYRGWIFWGLQWPALKGAEWVHLPNFQFRIFEPAGGLMLMMYAALAIGCVLAAPLWLWEIVRFINPALTPRERRVAMLLIPGAIGLFLAGAAFCYAISPIFFAFLFKFNVSLGVGPEVAMIPYLKFFVLCLVVFGLSFELPLVLLFLVYLGVLDSATLIAKWRTAVVLIVVLAAVATPTTDPLTMTLMALPMVLLYFLSIWLARLVERGRGEEPVETAAPADPANPDALHEGTAEDREEPEP